MYSLPVTIAKNPHDKESVDHLYFKGTNLLYNHQYEDAINVYE